MGNLLYKPYVTTHAIERFAERILSIETKLLTHEKLYILDLIEESLPMIGISHGKVELTDYPGCLAVIDEKSVVTIICV